MMRPNRAVRLVGLLAAGLLCLASVVPAAAQTAHEHQHAGAAVVNLDLDAGRKWATDASLRSGMAAIRSAFDADHAAIHASRETDAEYEALAARIETQVDDIVKNCKLPPAADANLHYVIADLLQGVSLMRGKDPARTRHDGAALVHGALIGYGTHFDDPGWTALRPADRSQGLVGAVAHRLVSRVLAGAEPRFLRFGRLELHWREPGPLV